MNIILCGLPFTGKSYFGKQLSEFLDWPLVDTDFLLEALYKKESNQPLNCRSIVQLKGDVYFRELEVKAIESLKEIKKSVISVGGGAIISTENIETLKKLGKLIYLKSEVEILIDRLQHNNQIPSYLDVKDPVNSFKELAKKRIPLYERYCDAMVDTKGLSDIEVLARITSHLL